VQICIVAGYLVFFMHCGFAMLSIGCVRAKFAKHISMLILVDACTSGIAFYLFGCASLLLCSCRPSDATAQALVHAIACKQLYK
jgi:ammonia channel protein AmtB